MILKPGMKHQGEGLYKIYIKHDPGMTLTILWQGQHRSPMHLMGKTLWKWANGLNIYDSKKGPQGQVCPHPGAIYMYISIVFKDLFL